VLLVVEIVVDQQLWLLAYLRYKLVIVVVTVVVVVNLKKLMALLYGTLDCDYSQLMSSHLLIH